MTTRTKGEPTQVPQHFKLGDRVRLSPFAGGRTGVVVEDWGPLGQGGEQILGVEVHHRLDDETWTTRVESRAESLRLIESADAT